MARLRGTVERRSAAQTSLATKLKAGADERGTKKQEEAHEKAEEK
jgi:hypothetical protein